MKEFDEFARYVRPYLRSVSEGLGSTTLVQNCKSVRLDQELLVIIQMAGERLKILIGDIAKSHLVQRELT